tara:strand:+ start:1979 stop:2806 length:828 start_codon:yes stop_codon:yes gene_type:complete
MIPDIPVLDLVALFDERAKEIHEDLNADWEAKMRREHEIITSATEERFADLVRQHREEVESLNTQKYEEGHAAGVADKEADAIEAVNRFVVLHNALKEDRKQILLESKELVVDLAVAIAEKIVGIRVEIDPEILMRTISRALEHLSENSNLVVKVHPADLEIARRFATEWVETVDQDNVLKVRMSDHVERGGCMIEGAEEFLDARLKEQFSTLRDELRIVVDEITKDSLRSSASVEGNESFVVASEESVSDGESIGGTEEDPGVIRDETSDELDR